MADIYSTATPKQCSKCCEVKSSSEFRKDESRPGGLRGVCKACVASQTRARKNAMKDSCLATFREKQREAMAAWRAANADKAKATAAAWRTKNSENIKATRSVYRAKNKDKEKATQEAWCKANDARAKAAKAAYRAKNKDRLKAVKAAWRIANLDRLKKLQTTWRKENPEKGRISWQNRRARIKAAGGQLSHGLAKKLFKLQKGMCPCCKQPLGDDYHLDHVVPLALGGSNTDDNAQLLRKTCNLQKSAAHPVEFMQSRGFLL